MVCSKCHGLMVADEFRDDVYGQSCWMAKCLNCGRAVDETSILNKYHPPSIREKYCKKRENAIRMLGRSL